MSFVRPETTASARFAPAWEHLHPFARSAFWYAGGAALLKLCSLAVSLWLARSLSVAEYGVFGLYYAIQTAIGSLGAVGIGESVIALLARYQFRQGRTQLFAAANRVFLLTATLSIVGACFLAIFVSRNSGGFGLLGLAGTLASGMALAFVTLQAGLVRLEERHSASLAFAVGIPLVGLVGSVVGLAVEMSPESFFLGGALGMLVSVGALVVTKVAIPLRLEDLTWVREIARRLPPYVVIALLGWLGGYGNNVMVVAMFDAEEVARFTFALSVGVIMQLVASAMNQVWNPRFYQLTHKEAFETVEMKSLRFFSIQGIILGLVAAACLVGLPPALRGLGGQMGTYASMPVELFWIFASYVAVSPCWHCQNYLFAYDKGRTLAYATAATSIVGIGIWILLMWVLGADGVYAGFFVQMLIRSIGYVVATRQYWPIKIAWSGICVGMLFAVGGLLLGRSVSSVMAAFGN